MSRTWPAYLGILVIWYPLTQWILYQASWGPHFGNHDWSAAGLLAQAAFFLGVPYVLAKSWSWGQKRAEDRLIAEASARMLAGTGRADAIRNSYTATARPQAPENHDAIRSVMRRP